MNALSRLLWVGIAVLGAIALAIVALSRGEMINSVWLVAAAICTYLIAYRFYGLFIGHTVMQVDANRTTPAYRHNDGLDYVPTNRYVLFGHHFAAIAGAGPLVGPVLAAQMGYLPGTLWILAGVVFAGAVQDSLVLFLSTRRDGRSLGEIIRSEMGATAGAIALIGVFLIMIIILAVLALVVVKALAGSPWGAFTVMATIPIAIFMGLYLRFIRPGKIGEMSIIGFVLLMTRSDLRKEHRRKPDHRPIFQLFRRGVGDHADQLWLCRLGPSSVALARAARLSVDVSQNRRDRRFGSGHPVCHASSENGRCHALHRRHRPGLFRRPVPLPLHHHSLRRGVGLSRADLIRHDAQDDRERNTDSIHRLWRDAHGELCRNHGDGCGERD